MKRFTPYQIKRDIKRTFLVSLLLSLSVFGWLRIMFFDFPFSIAEELSGLLKTIAIYWLLTLGIKMVLNLCLVVFGKLRRHVASGALPFLSRAAVAILFMPVIFSCNLPTAGIKKDLTTGMVTTYSGLVPAKVSMVMNGEELHHTDIPLGESFTIINNNINGFEIKDGKVSVGCALKITDKSGKELLNEPDLFNDTPTFQPDSARTLRCQVNTGRPMDLDQKYAVSVVFWDKFGKGKIENSTEISMISEP